jgi:hypothetical protein
MCVLLLAASVGTPEKQNRGEHDPVAKLPTVVVGYLSIELDTRADIVIYSKF